jgi:hypothetical protein
MSAILGTEAMVHKKVSSTPKPHFIRRHNGLISIHQISKFGETVVLLLYILQSNDFRNNDMNLM